jgi:ABC-2 type transport system ATP-binding protein
VRIEKDQAHRFVTNVVEAFPGEIDAVSIAKPSLEDVFIKRTGHRFWTEGPSVIEGAPKSKARKH